MIQIKKVYARTVPQIFLALEAVRLGEVEARDAYTNLLMDAEILVDDAELAKIKAQPEVQQALGGVVAPDRPEYKAGDWRSKGSEMRNAQWKQKPVIDYIASTYKPAVIKAVNDKFASLPDQWRAALMAKPSYRLETKGLQLSPTEDKKWKSIFVQLGLDLGDAESGDGFLGKLAQEFDQALAQNQVQEAADGLVWKSSLTGLESMFKALDPYAGVKPSSHKIQNHDVARWGEGPDEAEPGYDLHVKEGMLDQIQNALSNKLFEAMNISSESVTVSDDGVFSFKAMPPEPATDQEQIADNIEEEPTDEPTL